MHKQLNYQQFTLYWVDALSYEVFIKVFLQSNCKILVTFFINPVLRRLDVSFSSGLC